MLFLIILNSHFDAPVRLLSLHVLKRISLNLIDRGRCLDNSRPFLLQCAQESRLSPMC